MAAEVLRPKSVTRAKVWSEEVEEAYRFQLAGYRDEAEYLSIKKEVGFLNNLLLNLLCNPATALAWRIDIQI